MKQFQRFLYSILFIVFCSISSLAQNHLEFMQISIDGDLDSFEQKLLEKDFSKSYHSYLGFFYKTLCSVSVKVDPTTEKVHKISINFCQGTTNLTKNEIEIGLSYRNTSINVLKHNTTIEHNSMFNISNLLSASSCTCEYHMSNYVESPNQNFSNFYIQMNNTKEEIKNAKLTSNNENYNSFYNLHKVNESYYNLTIMTQCQKTKQMKAKVDDYTKGNYLPIKTNKNLNNNEHYIMMNFSFEHNNTEYNFEYVKICKYKKESLAIGSSIIMLLIAFLYKFLSTYIHIGLKEIKEINEMTEIPW